MIFPKFETCLKLISSKEMNKDLKIIKKYNIETNIKNIVKNCYLNSHLCVNLSASFFKENFSIESCQNIKDLENYFSNYWKSFLENKVPKEYFQIALYRIIRLNSVKLYSLESLIIKDKNGFDEDITITFILSLKDVSIDKIILGGSIITDKSVEVFDGNSPFHFILNVNSKSCIKDLLNNFQDIQNIIFHESKHIFDIINGVNYKKSKDNDYNKYIARGELEAYTGNFIREIKKFVNQSNVKDFNEICNKSEIINLFKNKKLFDKFPNSKKYMLNKGYQYFQHLINNFK